VPRPHTFSDMKSERDTNIKIDGNLCQFARSVFVFKS
jgi:hypothetical protein